MYKVSVRNTDREEVLVATMDMPPDNQQQLDLLYGWPDGYFIDICRWSNDGISDTANFRQEVDADLEPFSIFTGELQ